MRQLTHGIGFRREGDDVGREDLPVQQHCHCGHAARRDSQPDDDGLTPSMGTVQLAVDAAPAGYVHVLVRNRGGGYVYSDDDVRTMCADIAALRGTGVGGVVPALAAAGVAAVHLSARTNYVDPYPAGPGGGAQELDATDPVIVAAARVAVPA
ncbi:copper homeostasis protein CutC [Paenarthrobacter sp. NPDC056912]|uniref:copper homeostasis protein CutC n=1 Tax=Paenarthrobacter sp. NPDC056912 TaxID=3345965 RepID=UPI0036727C62